jgi:hypothetical protein
VAIPPNADLWRWNIYRRQWYEHLHGS